MVGSGIEIIRGQLEQLKAQRERIYTEQLLPLDDAIGHLEKLVGSQNGNVKSTAEAPAPLATREKAAPKTGSAAKSSSQSKSSPVKNTKAPAKSQAPTKSKSPAKSKAPGQAPAPSTPEVTETKSADPKPAKTTAPKSSTSKPGLRLKATYREKRVDEAIAELLDSDPTKTWKSEEVMNAISAPASKAELATYLRSIRLSLSLGADKKKWQKVANGPAAYASNSYKAAG